MELDDIKNLMAAMGQLKMKKIAIKEKDGSEIVLERETETFIAPPKPPPVHEDRHVYHGPSHEKKEKGHKEKVQGSFISSPLVGTFYASPSPDDSVFIKVGDKVNENTVVCIIEAMKVMNEVKAGISGIVKEVLVNNAQPVEFGTKLFLVE